MLRAGSVVVDGSWEAGGDEHAWQRVHQQLRGLRRKRSALDAEEARLLVLAEQLRVWRQFGCATLLAYLERVLGLSPREGMERMRVARALATLPALSAALAADQLHYTVIRELTRKVTPETEQAWLTAVRGKSTREVDELLEGHKPGDLPSDPTDRDLRLSKITFELPPQVHALLRQARSHLADELGRSLDDAQLLEVLCRRAMEPATTTTNKPPYQIALTVCAACNRGTQNGAGREIAVGAEVIARAKCDAEHLGRLDAAKPARVTTMISARKRRQVFARDHHRCTVPGCRSARNLEVHHIIAREHGGTHELSNLTLLCSACHAALHEQRIAISGTAPDKIRFEFLVPIDAAPTSPGAALDARRVLVNPGGEPTLLAPGVALDARSVLVNLGFKPGEARAAVELAQTREGRELPLEKLVFHALRLSRRPLTA